MELLTTSDRVPERLRRLENALSAGAATSDSIVYDFQADTSSYLVSDLSKLAGVHAIEVIFEGVVSGTLALRPNSDGNTALYMNRRHRHWQTDNASAVGHDISAVDQYGLIMEVPEWSGDNGVISRGLFGVPGRPGLGATWMCDWTTIPTTQQFLLRSSVVGKWYSAAPLTSLQFLCTGVIRAGSRLVVKSAERGAAGPQGATGPQGAASTVPGPTGPTGAKGTDGTMEVYQQPNTPASANTGAIWIDTDEVPSSTQNLVPTGPAGGDLEGNYPNPTLKGGVLIPAGHRMLGPYSVNSGSVASGAAAGPIYHTHNLGHTRYTLMGCPVDVSYSYNLVMTTIKEATRTQFHWKNLGAQASTGVIFEFYMMVQP